MAMPSAPPKADEPVQTEVLETEDAAIVPMANPVRLQGIVTIILTALLAIMVAGVVMYAFSLSQRKATPPPQEAEQPTSTTAPVQQVAVTPEPASGPARGNQPTTAATAPATYCQILGMRVDGPVVFAIDTGRSMEDVVEFANYLTRLAIRSLPQQETFIVELCKEDSDEFMDGEFHSPGPQSDKSVAAFLETISTQGVADLPRSLAAALEKNPKTIVLFRQRALAEAADLGAQAKGKGVRIVVVALDSDPAAKASLTELAKGSGGDIRAMTSQELETYLRDFPLK